MHVVHLEGHYFAYWLRVRKAAKSQLGEEALVRVVIIVSVQYAHLDDGDDGEHDVRVHQIAYEREEAIDAQAVPDEEQLEGITP